MSESTPLHGTNSRRSVSPRTLLPDGLRTLLGLHLPGSLELHMGFFNLNEGKNALLTIAPVGFGEELM